MAIVGATLVTVTDRALARSRKVPSSSVRSTGLMRLPGPPRSTLFPYAPGLRTGVGVGVAVPPVDDVPADCVRARVGDGPQGQAVDSALFDAGRPADGDRRRHVVDRHAQGVGPVQEGAVR